VAISFSLRLLRLRLAMTCQINYPAASSGVPYVMPDLIRHPVRFLDSGVRRNDGTPAKPRGIHP
jgi:hypothetical protein